MMKHMLCIISKVDCFSLCYTIFIVGNDFIANLVCRFSSKHYNFIIGKK